MPRAIRSNPDGETVPNGSARNILQLMLVASPDGAGDFQLIMHKFDSMNQDNGSSWLPADASTPSAFDNAAESDLVLGIINVSQTFPPGDYNRDGVVDPLDYEFWRAHFGNTVSNPGEDADGSRNSVIDSADYVVWRKNLPVTELSSSLNEFGKSVPEPGTFTFTVVGLAVTACCRSWLVGRHLSDVNRKS